MTVLATVVMTLAKFRDKVFAHKLSWRITQWKSNSSYTANLNVLWKFNSVIFKKFYKSFLLTNHYSTTYSFCVPLLPTPGIDPSPTAQPPTISHFRRHTNFIFIHMPILWGHLSLSLTHNLNLHSQNFPLHNS